MSLFSSGQNPRFKLKEPGVLVWYEIHSDYGFEVIRQQHPLLVVGGF
ncbi:MAG: hypothetical protein HWQ37_28500 [Nostoc sp. NMS4]|nr:hypothetical protein [Nostoc sp. NMS4]